MQREVFVDASAWIALNDRGDQYHQAAVAIYYRLLQEGRCLVTTNLVVAEAQIIIRRKGGFGPAIRFLESIRQTHRLQMIYADPDIDLLAERILRQFSDHELSLADAASFAVMRQREITDAFTFDRHFQMAGFTPLN
ncbi:MAG: Ribonuclease VapC20 [Chloroflexi bacterium ADurb.Bin325]|nr:MAG: Ribonuclease VapC20 [Chloroflexi bacterium ADurb.Bin325]